MSHTPDQIVSLCRACAATRGQAVSTVSRLASGSGATVERLHRGADITTSRATRIVQWLSDHWPESAEWPPDIPRPAPSPDGDPDRSASPASDKRSRSGETARSDGHTPGGGPPMTGAPPAARGPSTAAPGPAGDGNPNPPAGGQGHDSLTSALASTPCAGVPARGGTLSAGPAASLKRPLQVARTGHVTAPSADPAVPFAAWPLDARGHVRDEAALADTLRVARATVYTTISRYADDGPRAHRWPRGRRSDSHRTLRALLATGDVRFRRRRAQWAAMTGLGAAA